jgi:predicted O-methyltransferase YrrM
MESEQPLSRLQSGFAPVDRYLDEGYESVRGMSSRFAAAISAWCLKHQAAHGVSGHFAEIGTFQGRYFIALALALEPGERALGIDLFDWPSAATLEIFEDNCGRWGVDPPRRVTWKADSTAMSPAALQAKLGRGPVRFFHIDGDHSPEPLMRDLELAKAVMHPQGLICLDDMLHPGYPFLVTTVQRWLEANPEFRLMCVIDREDIVAAPKFLICRLDAVPLYETALMSHFSKQHFVLGGDALGHHCVVLTPHPRIAEVD